MANQHFEYFGHVTVSHIDPANPGRGLEGDSPHYLGLKEAWSHRQADPKRAIEKLGLIDSYIANKNKEIDAFIGRCRLIKTEITGLSNGMCRILDDIIDLLSFVEGVDNDLLYGDCLLLLADCYISRGETKSAQESLSNAVSLFHGDKDRRLIAQAKLAQQQQYDDPDLATKRWGFLETELESSQDSPASPFIYLYIGSIHFQNGNFPDAIRFWQKAFDEAKSRGAVLLSIQAAMMIGSAFSNLYDLPTAIEWKERAYDLAKETGWPEAIGTSLSSLAETTTAIGALDRARDLFEVAMPYLERLDSTRRHAISYIAYGNLCLSLKKYNEALVWFDRSQSIVERIGHSDLNLSTGSGRAAALLGLGKLQEAGSQARKTCLAAADSGIPYYQIEALRVFSAIQRAEDGNPEGSIQTLERAISVGEALGGLTLRAEILDLVARDYEAIGNYERALHYERRARDSWQRNFDQQNGARILAMQVRFDTARAKADAEHHRQLAAAEAARAAALDQANKVLERLSDIGQEVTARLDSEGVFAILSRHIHELMVADCLYIGLLDEAGQVIDIRFRIEDGQRLPPRQVALASENLSARCVRDNEEILVEVPDPPPSRAVPGTRPMRTVLLRPLTLGARVLGVVSVQCDRMGAYGPRELLIFRTLCAYGAIALANADAYGQLDRAVTDLRAALNRLVQQEKMAALGQLVAGVAHEVNTPLGVTLSAISQLHDNILELKGTLERNALTRTSLADHLRLSTDLADLAQRNTVRAAEMIRSFKEVAVDRDSDDRRRFELGDYLREVAALMRSQISGAGNEIEFETGIIHMDTYPGALARAVSHLLANCADHAYPAGQTGTVRVEARMPEPAMVEIRIIDRGVGVAVEHLPKLFDPFFTTGRASGHMGLGLHIAFNQVTQQLRGTIAISSTPGAGTVATIRIPRDLSTSDGLPLA